MTWTELEDSCKKCKKCPLCLSRTNVVFGKGNTSAKIMFIGEAPGENEDKQGIPFIGRAGQLLDKYLEAVGIDPGDIYVANILKCRPPQNRDPLPEEEEACMDHLRNQVRLINPKLIVCLGRISAQKLIDPEFKISSQHGMIFKKGRFEICAVYHPSFLLRNPAGKKEEMLTDMKMIANKINEIKNAD